MEVRRGDIGIDLESDAAQRCASRYAIQLPELKIADMFEAVCIVAAAHIVYAPPAWIVVGGFGRVAVSVGRSVVEPEVNASARIVGDCSLHCSEDAVAASRESECAIAKLGYPSINMAGKVCARRRCSRHKSHITFDHALCKGCKTMYRYAVRGNNLLVVDRLSEGHVTEFHCARQCLVGSTVQFDSTAVVGYKCTIVDY